MLRKRLSRKWPLLDDGSKAGFSMGKWGLPVNILAVLWGGAMTLNLIWPRTEIYNSVPPFEWYLQWGGVIFVAVVTAGGVVLYRFKIRHQTGVLAEHAAMAPVNPTGDSARSDDSETAQLAPDPVRHGVGVASADITNEIPDALAVDAVASNKGA